MSNRAYLKGLADQLRVVPRVYAAAVAVRIFQGLVEKTHFDSGQAVLNWHVEPYIGSPSFEAQKMMWGYGKVQATAPAGRKWSNGANEALVKQQFINNAFSSFVSIDSTKFDGIVVYNPITPGFANFAPGNDAQYEFNALSDAEVKLVSLQQQALSEAEDEVRARFSFVR